MLLSFGNIFCLAVLIIPIIIPHPITISSVQAFPQLSNLKKRQQSANHLQSDIRQQVQAARRTLSQSGLGIHGISGFVKILSLSSIMLPSFVTFMLIISSSDLYGKCISLEHLTNQVVSRIHPVWLSEQLGRLPPPPPIPTPHRQALVLETKK